MKKKLSIIGSTGSIGTQALDIVRCSEDFEVLALSAGNNLRLLVDQIKEFKPKYTFISKDADQQEIKELFPHIKVLKSLTEIAALDGVDLFLSAIVGIEGLEANLTALKHAKRVAIANKETLVCAPHLVQAYSKHYGSELMPVDSEHVAVHQCLRSGELKTRPVAKATGRSAERKPGAKRKALGADSASFRNISTVKEVLLTSSGGPFRTWPKESLKNIKLEDALKHPTWKMGHKITIDSSTLVNKGLEVIELNTLFGIDYDKIKVLIHPQSIVHSAVSFVDGNTIAQMSVPDMRIPIHYAMYYPERPSIAGLKQSSYNVLDLTKLQKLEFDEVDLDKFPALELAYYAGREGGSLPSVLNSANECAVSLYLAGAIHYLDIVKIIEKELSSHKIILEPSMEEILELDKEIKTKYIWARTK
jgi:1-deoxy-D-xylulose-5-phosphate reductoisomerase